MAASNEWTEYHLTPEGWVVGDQRKDFGDLKRVEAPVDRVLTVTYQEISNGYGAVQNSLQENWRSDDDGVVVVLLAKFGSAPKSL
jgi:hypothetical protein